MHCTNFQVMKSRAFFTWHSRKLDVYAEEVRIMVRKKVNDNEEMTRVKSVVECRRNKNENKAVKMKKTAKSVEKKTERCEQKKSTN